MRSITVQQLSELDAPSVIDVREPDEVAAVRAVGVTPIPMATVPTRLDELPDGTVYLICKSGGRSGRVAEYLEQQGYDVVNVEGGTDAWVAAGLPTESGAA
ncbi:rhodanese-like domain-containing protein [Schumannella sp. 10F1B-5-1]|uniref:rhodanese-like domain-containing protein n=1 Tax=Schumannella sp. 10F1B-5-1 TaxID=2590780 RepID=UPI001132927C|nr:rhodanese-like domain-containing protein [Schumannella sp. 10F1B-5-1]TPW72372.1 rhodanese-like domain-containing protein [Schumannella sp. 10F1B-5-1]